jgi:DNA-binding MarR family transcriptional regulator
MVGATPTGPWLNAEEQRIWRGLIGVHAKVTARLDDELQAAHGLALADYEVLVQLSETPDRSLRMSELASLVRLSPSGLTRRVDSLVRRGLVAREACTSDGRGSYAVLTDTGLSLLQSAAPTHVAGVRAYVIDPLSGSALAGLSVGLARVEAALDAHCRRCAEPGSASSADRAGDHRMPGGDPPVGAPGHRQRITTGAD